MRLDSLTIKGFGPFAATESIDFERLNQAGLFLISGPVGAGKTTLLDAICFALYGETTSEGQGAGALDGRSGTELRSTRADASQETSVELTFRIGAARYRVHRTPDYARPKMRGAGTTKMPSQAFLYRWRGDGDFGNGTDSDWESIASKVREVTSMVESIVGFTADQFRRVMVIPQGRFRDVLIAHHDERQELLKRIFGTQVFERFSQIVEDRERACKLQSDASILRMQQLLTPYPWSVGLSDQDATDKIATELEAAEVSLGESEQQLRTILRDRDRLNIDLGAARSIATLAKELEAVNLQADQLALRRQELEPVRKEWEEARSAEAPALKLKHRRQLEQEFARQQVDLDQHRVKLEKHQVIVESKRQARELAEQEFQSHAMTSEKIGSLSEQLKHHQKEQQAYQRLLDDADVAEQAWQTATARLAEARHRVPELLRARDLAEEQLQTLRGLLQGGLAARLAKDLTPDCPCPVCGSQAHPNPAKTDHDLPTDKELEQAQQRYDHAYIAHDRQVASLVVLEQDVEKALAARAKTHQCVADAPKPMSATSLEQEIADLQSVLQRVSKAREQAVSELEKAMAKFHSLERDLGGLQATYDSVVRQCQASREEWELSLSISGFTSEAMLDAATRDIDWMRQTETLFQELDTNWIKIEERQKTLVASLAGRSADNIDELEQRAQEIGKECHRLTERKAEAQTRVKNLRILQEEHGRLVKEVEQSTQAYQTANTLAKMVNGKMPGEERISLHSWVLGAVMERVLVNATQLLSTMTRGRYQLLRQSEPSLGGGQKGLEIAVHDTWHGTSRPARTLSGGETFLASLALSLALAETAAEYQGGRALETVFIDEGFGFLDAESLECAVAALHTLREQGRVVGVISHLEEMQRSIVTQLRLHQAEDITKTEIIAC